MSFRQYSAKVAKTPGEASILSTRAAAGGAARVWFCKQAGRQAGSKPTRRLMKLEISLYNSSIIKDVQAVGIREEVGLQLGATWSCS